MSKIACLIMSLSLLASFKCRSEDEAYYTKVASDFIAKNSDEKREAKWQAKWKDMCETAANDNGEDEEKFLNRYAYDWLAAKKASIEGNRLSVEDKLLACRIYLMYKQKHYQLPSVILSHLTKENLDNFVSGTSGWKIRPQQQQQQGREDQHRR